MDTLPSNKTRGSFLFPAASTADGGVYDDLEYVDIDEETEREIHFLPPTGAESPNRGNKRAPNSDWLPAAESSCAVRRINSEESSSIWSTSRRGSTGSFLTSSTETTRTQGKEAPKVRTKQDDDPNIIKRVSSELSLGSKRYGTRNGGGGTMRKSSSRISFECHGSVIFDEMSLLVDQEIASGAPPQQQRMGRCESEISLDPLLQESGGDESMDLLEDFPSAAASSGSRILRNSSSCASFRPPGRRGGRRSSVSGMGSSVRRSRSSAAFRDGAHDSSMIYEEEDQQGREIAPAPARLPRRISFECHSSLLLEELGAMADGTGQERGIANNSSGGTVQNDKADKTAANHSGSSLQRSGRIPRNSASMLSLASIFEGEEARGAHASVVKRMDRGIVQRECQQAGNRIVRSRSDLDFRRRLSSSGSERTSRVTGTAQELISRGQMTFSSPASLPPRDQ